MKNSTFLAAVLLVVVSCSSPRVEPKSSKKDLKISVQVDTMITCQEPITANRYSCSGQRLMNPKLIGIKNVEDSITLKKDTIISGDSLLKWGYVYDPQTTLEKENPAPKKMQPAPVSVSNTSDFSWLWNLLKWIGAILLLLAILALAGWLLRELFLALQRKASRNVPYPTPSFSESSDRSSKSSHSQDTGKENFNRGGSNQGQQDSSSGGGSYDQNSGGIIQITHVEHLHLYVNRERKK